MRGSISPFGFDDLTESMRLLESGAKAEDKDEVLRQWPNVQSKLNKLVKDIDRFVNN